MEKLIDRLWAATGPDRILDALVQIALDQPRPEWANDTGTLTLGCDTAVMLSEDGPGWYPPEYTKSIDVAVALVGEAIPGASWLVKNEDHHETGFQAEVWISWGPKSHYRYSARCCKTPALALCAALLSAKILLPA